MDSINMYLPYDIHLYVSPLWYPFICISPMIFIHMYLLYDTNLYVYVYFIFLISPVGFWSESFELFSAYPGRFNDIDRWSPKKFGMHALGWKTLVIRLLRVFTPSMLQNHYTWDHEPPN